jgi:hypothetical protein
MATVLSGTRSISSPVNYQDRVTVIKSREWMEKRCCEGGEEEAFPVVQGRGIGNGWTASPKGRTGFQSLGEQLGVEDPEPQRGPRQRLAYPRPEDATAITYTKVGTEVL